MNFRPLATIAALASALSLLAPTSAFAFAPPSKSKASHAPPRARSKRGRVSRRVATPRPKLQRSSRAKVANKIRMATLPEGTAAVSSALLNYVDGKRGSKRRRRIARALDALPGGKAAAERIAARIRAQPNAVIKRHTGVGPARLGSEKATLGGTVTSARKRGYLSVDTPLLTSAITLPAEDGSTLPAKVSFAMTGVHCHATEDADGEDELVVLFKSAAIPGASQYTTFQGDAGLPGTLAVAAGKSSATAQSIELSGDDGYVIISAVAEADGDAKAKRQELEVALEIARALAVDMNDTTDPAAALILAVEYAQSMLAMSNPNSAPSLQARRLDPGGLLSAWSASPNDNGGVPWKAAIEHELSSGGAYTVLFNVPSNPGVGGPVVHVLVSKVTTDFQVGLAGHLELGVAIRDEGAHRKLSKFDSSKNRTHVRRRVRAGVVRIRVSVDAHSNDGNFGVPNYSALTDPEEGEEPQALDVAPGSRTVLFLDYDPETDTLRQGGKMVTKTNSGGFMTFEGSGSTRAKVKLKVFKTK